MGTVLKTSVFDAANAYMLREPIADAMGFSEIRLPASALLEKLVSICLATTTTCWHNTTRPKTDYLRVIEEAPKGLKKLEKREK